MKPSSETKDQALSVVTESWLKAEEFRRPFVKEWNEAFRLVNGIQKKDRARKAWQSQRFVPLIGMVRDLIVPRLYQGMPDSAAEGLSENAELNEDALNSVLDYDQAKMDLETVMNKVVKDAFDYGLGIRKDYWRTETADNLPHDQEFLDRMLSEANKMLKKAVGGQKMKQSQLLYDGPDVEWTDPFNFFWDPAGDSIDHMSFCGEVYSRSLYRLRKDPRISSESLKEIKEFETGAVTEPAIRERMRALGYTQTEITRSYAKIRDGEHEVIEYWGAFDINGDGIEEECCIILIDRLSISYCEQNPFWHGLKPYSVFQYDLVSGMFVGRSMVRRLKELQEEYNDATDQASDMRKLTLRPMLKYKLGSDMDPNSLQVAPGMPIGVESMQDLEWDRPPDFTPQLAAVLKEIRDLVQLVSGANDVALGQKDVGIGDNTATGASIAQQQTEMRYRQPAILLDLMMVRAGNMLISNEQQYRDGDLQIPSRDGGTVSWNTIRPQDLAGRFEYQMQSGTLQQPDPQQKVQNLVNAFKLVQNNQAYDVGKLTDMILEAMKINPASIKAPMAPQGMGGPANDKVAQLAQQPPQVQQQFLDTLSPQDRQLMEQALASQAQALANTTNGQPQPQQPAPGAPPPAPIQSAGGPPAGISSPMGA